MMMMMFSDCVLAVIWRNPVQMLSRVWLHSCFVSFFVELLQGLFGFFSPRAF